MAAPLTLIIPLTAQGESGLPIITRDLEWWIETNAQDLLDYGYVRVTREHYIPTQCMGDKRKHRR